MKIYVAAHCQTIGKEAAISLKNAGHEIVSTWLDLDFKPTAEHGMADRPKIAQVDHDEVLVSDALVLLAGPDRYPGGKFVEAGIAIGTGKKVIVVGRRENMLLWLPSVEQVETIKDAIALLNEKAL